MCANSAMASRSSRQPSDSPSVRRNLIDRCQRSPATSLVRIDADPSCRTTRSMPAVRITETVAAGRASARIAKALAKMTASQNTSPPRTGKRSRTGRRRCWRNRRASRRRAPNCHTQITSSAAGTPSSHRKCGSPKRTLLISIPVSTCCQPFLTLAPPFPASGLSLRSSPRFGITILNWLMSVPFGGPPG